MAIVETIPGIRALKRYNLYKLDTETKSPSEIHISRLEEVDIPEFRTMMIEGKLQEEYTTHEEKLSAVEKRLDGFYNLALQDVACQTMLIAKDFSRHILGGMEAEQFDVDDQNIGFIAWIYIRPDWRNKHIALALYDAYKRLLLARDVITFVMANVHHSNAPSRRLHAKSGLTHVYLRKPERSNWYYQQLRPLAESVELPITETDYFSPIDIRVIEAAVSKVNEQWVGQISIVDHAIINADGHRLLSIVCATDEIRNEFVETAAKTLYSNIQMSLCLKG